MSEKEMAGGGIPKVSRSPYGAWMPAVPSDQETREGGRWETVGAESAFIPRDPDGVLTELTLQDDEAKERLRAERESADSKAAFAECKSSSTSHLPGSQDAALPRCCSLGP